MTRGLQKPILFRKRAVQQCQSCIYCFSKQICQDVKINKKEISHKTHALYLVLVHTWVNSLGNPFLPQKMVPLMLLGED